MRKKPRSGSVLIIVLILLTVVFIMGMTMLTMRVAQTKSSVMMKYAVMAKYLAEAGMEDARMKLLKDYDFPPSYTGGRKFSYTEALQYPGDPSPIGEYKVTIDASRNAPGDEYSDHTIYVTAFGIIKDRDGKELACHQVSAVFDTAPKDRKEATQDNPHRFKYIEWQDQGAL